MVASQGLRVVLGLPSCAAWTLASSLFWSDSMMWVITAYWISFRQGVGRSSPASSLASNGLVLIANSPVSRKVRCAARKAMALLAALVVHLCKNPLGDILRSFVSAMFVSFHVCRCVPGEWERSDLGVGN